MRAEQRILGTRHSSLWRMLGTSPLIFGLMTGIARASETLTAVSPTRLLIARICRPRRQAGRTQQTRFDHRTKTEHPATILLPNPVAADDTERHATDGPVKIRRQINTRWGGGSRAAIAVTAFRVRCLFSTRLSVSHVRVRLTSRKSTNRLRRANSNVSRVASVHSVR
jgi:hypothetical protein